MADSASSALTLLSSVPGPLSALSALELPEEKLLLDWLHPSVADSHGLQTVLVQPSSSVELPCSDAMRQRAD